MAAPTNASVDARPIARRQSLFLINVNLHDTRPDPFIDAVLAAGHYFSGSCFALAHSQFPEQAFDLAKRVLCLELLLIRICAGQGYVHRTVNKTIPVNAPAFKREGPVRSKAS